MMIDVAVRVVDGVTTHTAPRVVPARSVDDHPTGSVVVVASGASVVVVEVESDDAEVRLERHERISGLL